MQDWSYVGFGVSAFWFSCLCLCRDFSEKRLMCCWGWKWLNSFVCFKDKAISWYWEDEFAWGVNLVLVINFLSVRIIYFWIKCYFYIPIRLKNIRSILSCHGLRPVQNVIMDFDVFTLSQTSSLAVLISAVKRHRACDFVWRAARAFSLRLQRLSQLFCVWPQAFLRAMVVLMEYCLNLPIVWKMYKKYGWFRGGMGINNCLASFLNAGYAYLYCKRGWRW